MFAAYSQRSQLTIASSPESASTWNSCERLPPIAPVSASTGRKRSPQRSKMRRYAAYITSYSRSQSARSRWKE